MLFGSCDAHRGVWIASEQKEWTANALSPPATISSVSSSPIPRPLHGQSSFYVGSERSPSSRCSSCPLSAPPPSPSLPSELSLFSRKVFVGGLPADVSPETVTAVFSSFGKVIVDWPRLAKYPKERRHSRVSLTGYVFLIYEEEASVLRLLRSCSVHMDHYFLLISSPTTRDKPAQIRPWFLESGQYTREDAALVSLRRTVFIGGLPRTTTAEGLACILEKNFGEVVFIDIDVDPELRYPKGAARAVFADTPSFINAIKAKFVRIPNLETSKGDVEIKPYMLGSQPCDECWQGEGRMAEYFCGDSSCLQYYCHICWDAMHLNRMDKRRIKHLPFVRVGEQTKLLRELPHNRPSPMAAWQSLLNPSATLRSCQSTSSSRSRFPSVDLSCASAAHDCHFY